MIIRTELVGCLVSWFYTMSNRGLLNPEVFLRAITWFQETSYLIIIIIIIGERNRMILAKEGRLKVSGTRSSNIKETGPF